MMSSLARTALMSAKGCQRRVSAGMALTLRNPRRAGNHRVGATAVARCAVLSDDVAVLDLRAARDQHVADQRGSEQPVADEAGDRVQARGELAGVLEGLKEVDDDIAVGRWRGVRARARVAEGAQRG